MNASPRPPQRRPPAPPPPPARTAKPGSTAIAKCHGLPWSGQAVAIRHPDYELRGGQMTPIDPVPRPRRNVELVLLVLALAVGIGAQALVGVDRQKAFDTDFWFQSGLLAAGRPRLPCGAADPRKICRPGNTSARGRPQRAGPGHDPPAGQGGRRHRQQPAALDPGGHGGRDRGHLVPQGPPDPAPLHLYFPGHQRRAPHPAAGSRHLRRRGPGCQRLDQDRFHDLPAG